MKQAFPWLFLKACVIGALAGCNTDSLEPDSRPTAIPVQSQSPLGSDTLTASADALLSTAAKNSNYGGALTMRVQITAPQDSTSRAVVRFDQAAISSMVGSGSLSTAILELPLQASGTAAAGNDIDVHRMLKGWTEGRVTWNCGEDLDLSNAQVDCPQTGWKMTGANLNAFQAAPTARAHLGPGQAGVARFDVTSDVQAFLSGASNHGWLVTAGTPSSRAVFWSREATLKPSLILSVSAPAAKQRLIRVVETGVEGGPAIHDTSYTFGTSVAYDFSVAEGYHDLRVTLDGQVVPSSGSIVMDTVHLLRASALKIVELPEGGEALLQSARAVLTSSDPAAAFQAHLDDVLDSYQSLDEAEVTRRLNAIYYLAFDPVQDSAALRRVDDALGGQIFDVYPRPTPTGALRSRALALESAEPPEPTVYLYVNGINTKGWMAGRTMRSVRDLMVARALLHPGDAVKLFYNRTSVDQPSTETPERRAARCFIEYNAQTAEFPGNDEFFQRLLLNCLATPLPLPPELDILEAMRQYIRLAVDSRKFEVDAVRLAERIQEWRTTGRHVIAVPHSQGNMMFQQAVDSLRSSGQFDPKQDSTCIGAMSLAAPTDRNWHLEEHYLKHVIVRGDLIPDLGEIVLGHPRNQWDRLDTPLSRRMDVELARLALGFPQTLGFYTVLDLGWGFALHSVDHSYLGQAAPKDTIAAGLGMLYKECSIGSVKEAFPGDTVAVGFTDQLAKHVIILNQNGRPLNGRRLVWASSAPDVASVDTSGTLTIHSRGTAVITGKSGERTATFTYVVTDGYTLTDSFTDTDGTLLADHVPDGGAFTWVNDGASGGEVAIQGGLLTGGAAYVELPGTIGATGGYAEVGLVSGGGFSAIRLQATPGFLGRGYGIQLSKETEDGPYKLYLRRITDGAEEDLVTPMEVGGASALRIAYHAGVVYGYLNGSMVFQVADATYTSFSIAQMLMSAPEGAAASDVTSFAVSNVFTP